MILPARIEDRHAGIDKLTLLLPWGSFDITKEYEAIREQWDEDQLPKPAKSKQKPGYIDRHKTAISSFACGHPIMAADRYKFHTEVGWLGINSSGVKVDFNPARIIHPYEFWKTASTPEEVDHAVSVMWNKLEEAGIRASLSDARIYKADLAKTRTMRYPVHYYRDAGLVLNLKYHPGKKDTRFPNSLKWGSDKSPLHIIMYDKGLESEMKYGMKKPSESSHLRMECSWQKTGVNQFGSDRVHDLLAMGADGWTQLYTRTLSEKLFRGRQMKLAIDIPKVQYITQAIIQDQGTTKGNILHGVLLALGEGITPEVIDQVCDVLKDCTDLDRKSIYRQREKAIKYVTGVYHPPAHSTRVITTEDYIQEIMEALAA